MKKKQREVSNSIISKIKMSENCFSFENFWTIIMEMHGSVFLTKTKTNFEQYFSSVRQAQNNLPQVYSFLRPLFSCKSIFCKYFFTCNV